MDSEAAAALLGALVGGVVSIMGTFGVEAWRERRRAEQLAHAFAGEIHAILDIAEHRKYLDGIKAYARLAHQGQREILSVRVSRNYFSVIEANMDSIGLLRSDLPLLVPRFLTFAKSVLEDLELLHAGGMNEAPAADLAVYYDELANVLEEAVRTGQRIITTVAGQYGSPH